MRNTQNTKWVSVGSNTSVTNVTASTDTKGFGYAQVIWCTTGDATVSTSSTIEHSDDNSTWSSIPGAIANTDWAVTTATITTAQPKVVLNLDLRGRKRYLKFTGVSAQTRHIVAIGLSSPADGVTNATDSGVTHHFHL